MKNEITNTNEDLNNELKIREREEFYEDKLLELKMQKFLDNYLIEHKLSQYKNNLAELKLEKESLLQEKENLAHKVSEMEDEKTNYENTMKDLDKKIKEAENTKKKLQLDINSQQAYLQKMENEDNLVNYIINNFSDDFKKEIYEICTKKVHEALKNNNNNIDSRKKINQDKNTNYNAEQKDSKFTMVSGQRGQFISYPHKMSMPQSGMPNMPKMAPMFYNTYNNNVMMYPMFMPMPPQNMTGYQNQFFFVPMPVNQNMQQNKERNNDSSKK